MAKTCDRIPPLAKILLSSEVDFIGATGLYMVTNGYIITGITPSINLIYKVTLKDSTQSSKWHYQQGRENIYKANMYKRFLLNRK